MTSFQILGILYIIVLGVCLFLMKYLTKIKSLNNSLVEKNSKLQTKINSLVEKNSKLQTKIIGFQNYIPGRKGILHKFALTHSSTKTNFKVTYEVEILEVSENKVKVSAYDFTSTDSFALDPSNHSMIVGFFQNQWVSKDKVELLVDKSDMRDSKIEQILT